jgi:hypothetical protein
MPTVVPGERDGLQIANNVMIGDPFQIRDQTARFFSRPANLAGLVPILRRIAGVSDWPPARFQVDFVSDQLRLLA